MAGPDPALVEAVLEVARPGGDRARVVGLCGAQGSGKSTLAAAVARAACRRGITAAVISIDDIYLTLAERQALAREVHPLLRTRGVPGTHDVGLGLSVFEALDRGEAASLPRFDKALDDRLPKVLWDRAPAGCELLLFEGWCVGARPQVEEALAGPVNELEATEDPHGTWRRYANQALAGPYQRLFERIDALVLLAAPGFAVVLDWRREQEAALGGSAMDEAALARFVAHYERLTRHILAEMPERADLVVHLDPRRVPSHFRRP